MKVGAQVHIVALFPRPSALNAEKGYYVTTHNRKHGGLGLHKTRARFANSHESHRQTLARRRTMEMGHRK